MKLYGLIGACSFVPHVALEWVKAHIVMKIMSLRQLAVNLLNHQSFWR